MYTNQKPYNIELAKQMLLTQKDFTFVKKITGLSIIKMLELRLIEWYYPFTKKVKSEYSTDLDAKWITIPDISVSWLRRVA